MINKLLKLFDLVLLTITGLIVTIIILIGLYFLFVWIFFWPSPPDKIIKITNNEIDIENEFHEINSQYWYKDDGKLVFNNLTSIKQKVSLYTDKLPSEKKKIGYITSNVIISGSFAKDCILGFEIGEKNGRDENHIIMGVSGDGEIKILNGDLEPLIEEEISYGPNTLNQCREINLSFYYYKNPYGWVIFFGAKGNDGIRNGASINYVPYDKLDSENKEISLVVYNPSNKGKIWFKNWEIQNDWTPND
ncbi:MAG: hypothetical protein AB7O47_04175 [Flavobacteriales bacterium]